MAMVILVLYSGEKAGNQPISAPKWDVKARKELGKALLKLSLPS